MQSYHNEQSNLSELFLGDTLGRAAASLVSRWRTRKSSAKPSSGTEPSPSVASTRAVKRVVTACRQADTRGFPFCRPTSELLPLDLSPFLLLDHCGPYSVNTAVGVDVPRCGQQTLTYVIQGKLKHTDSLHSNFTLRSGDAQIVTAGTGMVVNDTPAASVVEYITIWVNIPKERKNVSPSTKLCRVLPTKVSGRGHSASQVRILASTVDYPQNCSQPTKPLQLLTQDTVIFDVRLRRDAVFELPVHTARVLVYVYRGEAIIGSRRIRHGSMAVLEESGPKSVVLRSAEPSSLSDDSECTQMPDHDFDTNVAGACWCIVLAGAPLQERVECLTSGFVAGSPQEIRKAFQQYVCGNLGNESAKMDAPDDEAGKNVPVRA